MKSIIESKEEIGEELSIVLKKFDVSKNLLASSILDPRPIRIGDEKIKFYQIYLGSGYVVYIKVDKQKMPEELDKLSLGKLSQLHMVCGDFEKSKELSIFRKIGEKIKKELKN